MQRIISSFAMSALPPAAILENGAHAEENLRVLAVVNKWWECDPVVGALLNSDAHPSTLPWPSVLNHPRQRPQAPQPRSHPAPRAVFVLNHIAAEVWCVSDLLEHLPQKADFQSSSERKAEVLPLLLQPSPVSLVISVGTAGYPSDESENGNVVVGTGIFIHNGHPNVSNPASNWTSTSFDQLLPSSLNESSFASLVSFGHAEPADRFLVSPLKPAPRSRVFADHSYIALGVVNVTKYSEYQQKNLETLEAFARTTDRASGRSLETTHGLIRAQSSAPFMFISGITDRVGRFAEEVEPRPYAQNAASAHNAGVVLAEVLAQLDRTFGR